MNAEDAPRHLEVLRQALVTELEELRQRLIPMKQRETILLEQLDAIAVLTAPATVPTPAAADTSKDLYGYRLANKAAEIGLGLGDFHYKRDLLPELLRQGYRIFGPKPEGALLTSMITSGKFERVGRGTYRVNRPRPQVLAD